MLCVYQHKIKKFLCFFCILLFLSEQLPLRCPFQFLTAITVFSIKKRRRKKSKKKERRETIPIIDDDDNDVARHGSARLPLGALQDPERAVYCDRGLGEKGVLDACVQICSTSLSLSLSLSLCFDFLFFPFELIPLLLSQVLHGASLDYYHQEQAYRDREPPARVSFLWLFSFFFLLLAA